MVEILTQLFICWCLAFWTFVSSAVHCGLRLIPSPHVICVCYNSSHLRSTAPFYSSYSCLANLLASWFYSLDPRLDFTYFCQGCSLISWSFLIFSLSPTPILYVSQPLYSFLYSSCVLTVDDRLFFLDFKVL